MSSSAETHAHVNLFPEQMWTRVRVVFTFKGNLSMGPVQPNLDRRLQVVLGLVPQCTSQSARQLSHYHLFMQAVLCFKLNCQCECPLKIADFDSSFPLLFFNLIYSDLIFSYRLFMFRASVWGSSFTSRITSRYSWPRNNPACSHFLKQKDCVLKDLHFLSSSLNMSVHPISKTYLP